MQDNFFHYFYKNCHHIEHVLVIGICLQDNLFQELDKEFGDDPEETEIPDFDTDRFSTKSPELQTRTPSPDDPDEHYEMDIDYQDGNSNDKAETLRIDKTNKGKIYIAYLE